MIIKLLTTTLSVSPIIILHACCFDAVVKIGFSQETYTILESAESASVCIEKNGTTDLAISVTMNGSESLAHTKHHHQNNKFQSIIHMHN